MSPFAPQPPQPAPESQWQPGMTLDRSSPAKNPAVGISTAAKPSLTMSAATDLRSAGSEGTSTGRQPSAENIAPHALHEEVSSSTEARQLGQ